MRIKELKKGYFPQVRCEFGCGEPIETGYEIFYTSTLKLFGYSMKYCSKCAEKRKLVPVVDSVPQQ